MITTWDPIQLASLKHLSWFISSSALRQYSFTVPLRAPPTRLAKVPLSFFAVVSRCPPLRFPVVLSRLTPWSFHNYQSPWLNDWLSSISNKTSGLPCRFFMWSSQATFLCKSLIKYHMRLPPPLTNESDWLMRIRDNNRIYQSILIGRTRLLIGWCISVDNLIEFPVSQPNFSYPDTFS